MRSPEIDRLRRSGSDTGHAEFAERMVRALNDGLSSLEELPRDDGFWRGWANGRVTAHKLQAYAGERLDRDPGDRVARWALVALALARGASDGGLSFLGPGVAGDPAAVADALVIADWVGPEIGLDLTRELRVVFGWADRQALEELARTGDGQAARTALRVLDGGSLPV
ncbi:hypothetical protein ACFVSN_02040 [Kitasatospora sp. NPDC057904]|uniref:hypothetical protein n=1 Tax=unclassified Kitasatospora TaxID=2633591 RepID=UPI0036DDF4F4